MVLSCLLGIVGWLALLFLFAHGGGVDSTLFAAFAHGAWLFWAVIVLFDFAQGGLVGLF